METTLKPPKNQYALVLHTLMNPPKELSMGYWMEEYKSHKFSSRLGELEKKLGYPLAFRKPKDFVNRFGHKSQYMVYTPLASMAQYLEFYAKINV